MAEGGQPFSFILKISFPSASAPLQQQLGEGRGAVHRQQHAALRLRDRHRPVQPGVQLVEVRLLVPHCEHTGCRQAVVGF